MFLDTKIKPHRKVIKKTILYEIASKIIKYLRTNNQRGRAKQQQQTHTHISEKYYNIIRAKTKRQSIAMFDFSWKSIRQGVKTWCRCVICK